MVGQRKQWSGGRDRGETGNAGNAGNAKRTVTL